jgi:hypothetical protein
LEATSTLRVGVIATISTGSLASARTAVTFRWLPPDSSRTGWPRPADTRDRDDPVALAVLDDPACRATSRITHAAGHRPTYVTDRSGQDSRSAMLADEAGQGASHEASPGTARAGEFIALAAQASETTRSGKTPHARRPGRTRPGLLRRTRPG